MLSLMSFGVIAIGASVAFGNAHFQGSDVTAPDESGKGLRAAIGVNSAELPAGPVCFYGGDFDGRSAPSCERNTTVSESWIFDDFTWPGGAVTEVWGHFILFGNAGAPVAGDVAIFRGMAEGSWGAEVYLQSDITDGLRWTATGRQHGGFPEYELRITVQFNLAPGTYHIGVRPVGTGLGGYFISSTSGENGQGGPLRNGNAFFQSFHFGFPLPTDLSNIGLFGTYDFSRGLCGQQDTEPTLALEGTCPGVMTARVQGATPSGRLALIRSAPGGCGGQTTIPPSNLCSGTILPLGGAALVRIITADGEGNAAVTGSVPGSICGRVCLVALDLPTCEVSNVAEF